MPWVTFERDYNWAPILAWAVLYRAGETHLVVRAAAEAALKINAARRATFEEIQDARLRRAQ